MTTVETTISYLIAKCDWNGVYRMLKSTPEICSTPLPTDPNDYVIHEAICTERDPVPHEVLILLLAQFPNALDLKVFIKATENPHLSRRSMEILFEYANNDLHQTVHNNAQRFTSTAVKKNNGHIVGLLIDLFPHVLNSGEVLSLACMHGTAEIVRIILTGGLNHNVGKAGGLYLKINNREDALDIAIRLYDEGHEERRNILIVCLQYANAERMNMGSAPGNYPVLLAAAGLVPQHILKSFFNLYISEIINTTPSGRHAIFKAVAMSMQGHECGELPSIFNSAVLINACTNKNLDLVQQIFKLAYKDCSVQIKSTLQNMECDQNAIDVALDLFNKNDDISCEILKICVQYANASKLGWKVPPSNYPIMLAAVGLIPLDIALELGLKYPNDIKRMDEIGKFALKKVLKMAQDELHYAKRLDARRQYRLSFRAGRTKWNTTLFSLSEDDTQ